jgi:Rrf2 family transcriptional regulator, nitric oxide-sensitive transcriptional repressor
MTKGTDLALRVVMRLAAARAGTALTTREIAAAVGVPYTHAAKVVTRLRHLGVIEARRGRGGGLALAASGRSASVGAIVRALEGTGDVVGCEDDPPCPLRSGCRLRTMLHTAQEAFYTVLDPVTVADLVAPPTGPLLLGLPGTPGRSGPDPGAPPG